MLTGQLGEVMQESAQAAYSYAKARAGELGIDGGYSRKFRHPHPSAEGAIPKGRPECGHYDGDRFVSVLARRPVVRTSR